MSTDNETAKLRALLNTTPCTYFIGADEGPVKIGRTTKVLTRLGRLQVCCPIPIRILGLVSLDYMRNDGPGDPLTFESWCHRMLAGNRLHGEWFDRRAAIRLWSDYIEPDQTDFILVRWREANRVRWRPRSWRIVTTDLRLGSS